jgi:hypothetical protein
VRSTASKRPANVFLVQSPFQLLCALEAKHHFAAAENILVIKYGDPEERPAAQLRELARLDRWTQTLEVTRLSVDNLLFPSRQLARVERQFAIDKLFIGDIGSEHFRSAAMTARPRAVFLLDDGSGTIEAQSHFLARGDAILSRTNVPYSYSSGSAPRRHLKRLIRAASRLRAPAPTMINLFTSFDLGACPNQAVVRNRFDWLRQRSTPQVTERDVAYLFGSMNDEYPELLPEEARAIRTVRDHYVALGASLVYVPHRSEPDAKCAAIQRELGIPFRRFGMPAEVELAMAATCPEHIAAFVSTVLNTLPLIRKFSSVKMFLPPALERYRDITSYYSKKLEVIPIAS